MHEMERFTSVYTKVADSTFDEGQELERITTITPTDPHNYIAIAARRCKQHEGLVQLVGAQVVDPLTGLARCKTQPAPADSKTALPTKQPAPPAPLYRCSPNSLDRDHHQLVYFGGMLVDFEDSGHYKIFEYLGDLGDASCFP